LQRGGCFRSNSIPWRQYVVPCSRIHAIHKTHRRGQPPARNGSISLSAGLREIVYPARAAILPGFLELGYRRKRKITETIEARRFSRRRVFRFRVAEKKVIQVTVAARALRHSLAALATDGPRLAWNRAQPFRRTQMTSNTQSKDQTHFDRRRIEWRLGAGCETNGDNPAVQVFMLAAKGSLLSGHVVFKQMVGGTLAAGLADEQRLKVGQPDMIRPTHRSRSNAKQR